MNSRLYTGTGITGNGENGSFEPHDSIHASGIRSNAKIGGSLARNSRARSYQPVVKVVTAFDRSCIPADCVAMGSHTPGIHPKRAFPGGRRNGLGARGTFTTG